jgi:hypothetical protein
MVKWLQKEELYWQQLYARVVLQMLEALCGRWQTPTQATADGFLLQSSYLLLVSVIWHLCYEFVGPKCSLLQSIHHEHS